jgi:predicted PurR-regulated permease PerM
LINRILTPLKGTAAGQSFSAALNRIAGQYLSQNSSPLDFLSQALGGAVLGITVLISSFYLSLTSDGVERFIRALFPGNADARVMKLYHRARRKIGFWFQSQLFLTLIMGLLVWITLALLGVKHAFVLGIIAGFLELMPFVGPIISGALAVLIAITTSARLGFYTLGVFLVIQQFEGHFLVPLVTKKAVDLHPVIVIISLLIGLQIDGVLGALVAVPLAAVLQEIVEARAEEPERDREKVDAVI